MNFLKGESKREIKRNLQIQMENNKILRENLRNEQKFIYLFYKALCSRALPG